MGGLLLFPELLQSCEYFSVYLRQCCSYMSQCYKKDYSLGENCGKIVVVDSLNSQCDLCVFKTGPKPGLNESYESTFYNAPKHALIKDE